MYATLRWQLKYLGKERSYPPPPLDDCIILQNRDTRPSILLAGELQVTLNGGRKQYWSDTQASKSYFIHSSMNMNVSFFSGIQTKRFTNYLNKKTYCFNETVKRRRAYRILPYVYDGKYWFTNAYAWQGCHISLLLPSFSKFEHLLRCLGIFWDS